MAIKWTNKSAINREIEMAERHTDQAELSGISFEMPFKAFELFVHIVG